MTFRTSCLAGNIIVTIMKWRKLCSCTKLPCLFRRAKGDEVVKRLFSMTAIAVGFAAAVSPQEAAAQSGPGYGYGPVTEVDYIHVNYGHFAEYMAWVTSTWQPTMEAAKKAGLIIGYKVFQSSPKSVNDPNVYLEITYKNMAAYAGDIGDQADAFEAVTEKVICSLACQNQARVHRNEIRTVLGTEVTREVVFK